MRVHLDSGAHYGPATTLPEIIAASALLPKKWTGVLQTTVVDGGGPTGGFYFKLGTLRKTVQAGASWACAWKFKQVAVGANFGNGTINAFSAVTTSHGLTDIGSFRMEPDGTISLYAGNVFVTRTNAAYAISSDIWYTLETNVAFAAGATGPVSVAGWLRINGVVVASGIGISDIDISSVLSGGAAITSVMFGGTSFTSQIAEPIIYDNNVDAGVGIYNISSAQSGAGIPGMWLGDYHIEALDPDGDVLIQWTSTGANTYSVLAEKATGPNISTYVESNTVNQHDALDWEPVTPGYEILTLQLSLYANKNDAGTREIQFRAGATSAELLGPRLSLADDPIYHIGGRDNDPATGLQWAEAVYNAKQFGYNLEA